MFKVKLFSQKTPSHFPTRVFPSSSPRAHILPHQSVQDTQILSTHVSMAIRGKLTLSSTTEYSIRKIRNLLSDTHYSRALKEIKALDMSIDKYALAAKAHFLCNQPEQGEANCTQLAADLKHAPAFREQQLFEIVDFVLSKLAHDLDKKAEFIKIMVSFLTNNPATSTDMDACYERGNIWRALTYYGKAKEMYCQARKLGHPFDGQVDAFFAKLQIDSNIQFYRDVKEICVQRTLTP